MNTTRAMRITVFISQTSLFSSDIPIVVHIARQCDIAYNILAYKHTHRRPSIRFYYLDRVFSVRIPYGCVMDILNITYIRENPKAVVSYDFGLQCRNLSRCILIIVFGEKRIGILRNGKQYIPSRMTESHIRKHLS